MLGNLNILSVVLAFTAMGQYWFYKHIFPHITAWIVWGVVFVPWVTIFTITFCKRPPFGPRPFARCLLFAMCWYAFFTIAAEGLNCLLPLPPDRHFPITAARILMYGGWLTFIPLARSYIYVRRLSREPRPD